MIRLMGILNGDRTHVQRNQIGIIIRLSAAKRENMPFHFAITNTIILCSVWKALGQPNHPVRSDRNVAITPFHYQICPRSASSSSSAALSRSLVIARMDHTTTARQLMPSNNYVYSLERDPGVYPKAGFVQQESAAIDMLKGKSP